MKKIIYLIQIVLLVFVFHFNVLCQITYPLTGHPRLFFLPSEEAAVKNKLATNPLLNQVHNLILTECGKMLTLPVQQRVVTGGTMLNISREATRRITFLSYAYRMTGDNRYAARAETEMLAMAGFPDWNPSNQLDFTEMTLAMSIGYDWLYNYLGAASRTTIANAIKQKGIAETVGTQGAMKFFLQDRKEYNNNINSILNCNACIAAGVAAVYDEDPAYYQTLIDRAVYLVKFPLEVYQYNGSYPESVMYWDYGTAYLFMMIDMLQQMWGTDRDLLKTDGLLKTGNFAIHMHGNATQRLSGDKLVTTGYRVFNFGDGVEFYGPMFSMYGLAHFAPNQANMYLEMKKLSSNQSIFSPMLGFLPFLVIWSKNLSFDPVYPPVENTYIAGGKSALASLRTGWNSNDIYLGIKGGTPVASHCHMDAGSFVMDAQDVRWAMDYGGGTSTGTSRWDSFNFTNLAHNTLTINGNKQIADGYAPVENLTDTPDRKSVTVNLTSLYANDVSSLVRTCAIISNRYVEIKDSLKAGPGTLTVRWNMVTQGLPTRISNKIIMLTQATKKLYLIFDGTDRVTAKNWSPRPPDGPDSNMWTYAVGFEYSVQAGSVSTIKVKLVPEGDPMVAGLSGTSFGKPLDENFENFTKGSLSCDFVLWKLNPELNGTTKAVLGEVVPNPFKGGINSSDNVLKIFRQNELGMVNTSNVANYTYRGVNAYGYDLRMNPGSVLEFKYYKDTPGTFYLRAFDGNGNVIGKAFLDENEGKAGYSTAQWRTAQVALGTVNLAKYNYTPLGYLSLSVENNATIVSQAPELTVYIDDVKLLPLSATAVKVLQDMPSFYASFDVKSNQIRLANLPHNTKYIRLFDIMGRLLREENVFSNLTSIDFGNSMSGIYIVEAVSTEGTNKSVKVVCNK